VNRLCPTFDLRQRRSERLPALARHDQIEQHEIDRIALEHAAHGSTVRGIAHPQAFADEVASQHGADARLVVDDQDVHRLTHSRSAIEPRWRENRPRPSCHKASHFASFRY